MTILKDYDNYHDSSVSSQAFFDVKNGKSEDYISYWIGRQVLKAPVSLAIGVIVILFIISVYNNGLAYTTHIFAVIINDMLRVFFQLFINLTFAFYHFYQQLGK